jgi:hypothetical protein
MMKSPCTLDIAQSQSEALQVAEDALGRGEVVIRRAEAVKVTSNDAATKRSRLSGDGVHAYHNY